MNIVLLHYAAPPIVGGVETVLGQHARMMANDGHHVCIVAGRGGEVDARIKFVSVPDIDSRNAQILSLKTELDAGSAPASFEALAARIQSQLAGLLRGADRVILHNVCSLNKNLALTAALHRISKQVTTTRFILWHHDLAWITPRYRAELHDGYPWDLLRTDWPWAEQVVVSEQRRKELADLMAIPASRIHVIPNGLEVERFLKLEPETSELQRRLKLSEAAPLLLLPVRITPRKNIELALRVAADLRQDFAQLTLLVTGPLGPHNPANQQYFERLTALRAGLGLQERVHFLAEIVDHSIPDAVIADLYKLADILILPSREEGFGIPILEAGLAGVPVFCSDIEALREVGGSNVHYFSPDAEPHQIAAQISKLLASSQTFGLRKRVLLSYGWDRIYRNSIVPLLAKG